MVYNFIFPVQTPSSGFCPVHNYITWYHLLFSKTNCVFRRVLPVLLRVTCFIATYGFVKASLLQSQFIVAPIALVACPHFFTEFNLKFLKLRLTRSFGFCFIAGVCTVVHSIYIHQIDFWWMVFLWVCWLMAVKPWGSESLFLVPQVWHTTQCWLLGVFFLHSQASGYRLVNDDHPVNSADC